MKLVILVFLLFWTSQAIFAGTCTSISRTNNSPNTVLTSTKYNADLNTVYNNSNAYDLGCGTDGTLEKSALNTTDFAVPLNAIKRGCAMTATDAATLSIDKCYLSVNDTWVSTSAASTVTWGCSGCSTEEASQSYYVYAKTTSTASSLDLLISTTAPDGKGVDGSGNVVLGKFYNDSSQNIASSTQSWESASFQKQTVVESLVGKSGPYSVAIPIDNTIPQNTEGTEVLQGTIVPGPGVKTVMVTVIGYAAEIANVNNGAVAALFQDAGVDAIAATYVESESSGFVTSAITTMFGLKKIVSVTPGVSTTFKLRFGGGNATAIYLNVNPNDSNLGNTISTVMTIEEL